MRVCPLDFTFAGKLPVLVIPCDSLRAAQKRKRIENMSEEELRYALAKEVARIQMGMPSLSDAGFKGMKPSRIVECCNLADGFLRVFKGEA